MSLLKKQGLRLKEHAAQKAGIVDVGHSLTVARLQSTLTICDQGRKCG